MRAKLLLCAVLILLSGCWFGARGYDPSRLDALEVDLGELVEDAQVVSQPGSVPELAARRSVSEAEAQKVLPASAFRSFPAHSGQIHSLDISSDGRRIFTAGADGLVKQHELMRAEEESNGERKISAGYQLRSSAVYRSSEPVYSVRLNPDGRLLAIAQTGLLFVVDLQERRVVHRLSRLEGRITALAWDPSGELLGIGRSNGEVLIWNIKRGPEAGRDDDEAIERYRGISSPVTALVFHPLGRAFFAAHRDGVLFFWRLVRTEFEMGLRDEAAVFDSDNRGRKNITVTGINARVEDIAITADGSYLLIATNDGRILTLKVRGLVLRDAVRVGTDLVSSITPLEPQPRGVLHSDTDGGSPAGGTPALASYRDRQLRFWCFRSRETSLIATSPPLDDPAERLASRPGSVYLWAGQKSGNLLGFDADFLMGSPIFSSELSACSRLVLNEAG